MVATKRRIEVTLLDLVAAVSRFTDDERLLTAIVERIVHQPNLRLVGALRRDRR